MKTEGIVFQSELSIGVEPDAAILYDLSPNKNNGTFKGSGEPDWFQLTSGLWIPKFDGSDDTITLTHSAYSGHSQFTLAFWIWFDNLTSQMNFFNGVTLYKVPSSGVLRWYAGGADRLSSSAVVAQTYYFIAFTYSDPTASFYFNGLLNNSASYASFTTGNNLGMGGGAGTWFKGYLIPLIACKYSISAGQVFQYYEGTKHLFGVHD